METHGDPKKFHGVPWRTMVTHGSSSGLPSSLPRPAAECHGVPRWSIQHPSPWNAMELHGILRSSTEKLILPWKDRGLPLGFRGAPRSSTVMEFLPIFTAAAVAFSMMFLGVSMALRGSPWHSSERRGVSEAYRCFLLAHGERSTPPPNFVGGGPVGNSRCSAAISFNARLAQAGTSTASIPFSTHAPL